MCKCYVSKYSNLPGRAEGGYLWGTYGAAGGGGMMAESCDSGAPASPAAAAAIGP